MRLLVVILTFLLFVGIIGFVLTNLDTRVSVTFWKTAYHDLPLFLVVIVAVFAGVCYAGIIGVAEGAHTRLANRKLVQELGRLETEMNYVRTQAAGAPRPEPDVAIDRAPAPPPKLADPPTAPAPVYSAEDDWHPDDEDDAYSGGRAV